MRLLLRAAAMLAVVAWLAAGLAASDETRSVRIERLEAAPRLDDYLSGTGPGASVDGFKQREPGDLTPVSEPTKAFLSYDRENLYVAFVCTAADPSSIRARSSPTRSASRRTASPAKAAATT